jgi:hypothetical protein
MSQTERKQPATVYELTEVSALALGKYTTLAGLLGGIVTSVMLLSGPATPSFNLGLAWVATALVGLSLGGFLAGIVLASLYNVLSRALGGLRVHLTPLAPREAAGQVAASTKTCPACQATVRADLSFCPECDHTFPRSS